MQHDGAEDSHPFVVVDDEDTAAWGWIGEAEEGVHDMAPFG
jgi:hypothetical protein